MTTELNAKVVDLLALSKGKNDHAIARDILGLVRHLATPMIDEAIRNVLMTEFREEMTEQQIKLAADLSARLASSRIY